MTKTRRSWSVAVLAAAFMAGSVPAPAGAQPASSSPGSAPSATAPGASVGPSSGPDDPPDSAIAVLDAPGATLIWTRVPVTGGPHAREDHTLTLDPDGAAAYLFGGRDGDRLFDDVWRLDLGTLTWEQLQTGGPAPTARFGHAAAWMDGLGLVVFGGQSGSEFHADLWAFDPGSATWRRLPGGGQAPRARYGTCASVGPDGRLWVSHGFTSEGRFDDTRAWDPDTRRWRDRSPGGDRPVARCLHDCLWTPDGRLVLFGGQTNGRPALGDLWTYDPDARRWARGAGPGPTPSPRRLYALAGGLAAAWLVGGRDRDGDALDDVWRLDLATLSFSRPEIADGDVPAGRSGTTLVLDGRHGRLVLFGGEGRSAVLDDLWTLTPLTTTGSASPTPG